MIGASIWPRARVGRSSSSAVRPLLPSFAFSGGWMHVPVTIGMPTAPTIHCYHATIPLFGRKGGASALSPKRNTSPSTQRWMRRGAPPSSSTGGRAREGQLRRPFLHPSQRTTLPAVNDASELIDPDFELMMSELMRPIPSTGGNASLQDGGKEGREGAISNDEVLSKEEALRRLDLDRKYADMMRREARGSVAVGPSGSPTALPSPSPSSLDANVLPSSSPPAFQCAIAEYNRLLRAYGVQNRLPEAQALLRSLLSRQAPVSSQTLTAYVYACSACQPPAPEAAESEMQAWENNGLPSPDAWTWATLVSAYVRAGRREEALGTFQRMKLAGHPENLAACTSVLQALGQGRGRKDREAMLDFWIDMRVAGVEPDAVAYTVLLQATCVSTGDLERGLSYLDEMEQLSVLPTLHVFNTLLFTAARAPLWFPGYSALLYELLARLESSGWAPDAVTYQGLVRICAQAGNPLLAERYIERMQEEGRQE
ncbi:pentatricopeptide repeat-containing protein [Nannochloropsis gaditana]|uniref:Pentatricopeptide repeat-containing protein n=1 Tax=Nannochloropsis gaditana TaxID=72520 RepID=W7TTQ2_9STRA|nr:pentatricopeptide repeat-containing protein [Nannochloropsis gaditana]